MSLYCKQYMFNGSNGTIQQKLIFMQIQKIDFKQQQALSQAFKEKGAVIFKGIETREQFLKLSQYFGNIIPDHEGSLTSQIYNREDPGLNAFSKRQLNFHTDRPSYQKPPQILMLRLIQEPQSGGDSQLVDGHVIHNIIRQRQPKMLEQGKFGITFTSNSGNAKPYKCSVFQDKNGDNINGDSQNMKIRCRFGKQAIFDHKEVEQFLTELFEANKIIVQLKAGDGYIIDNTRWVHGRKSFEGARRSERIMLSKQKE